MGICPLYYTEADGWLLWGSEIKALLASGMVAARPDPKGIDLFFNTFCAGTTRTFFEGIKSIPPGHYLRVRDGRVELKRYWDLDFPDAGQERRLDDPTPLVDELESLMRQAVERRLRGDVPVVSYISGGLDSTVVLGLSSRQRGHAVPSFTIGLDRAGPDERSHATESAAALGSRLTTVTMNRADIVAAYPELIRAAEGPVMDSSSACLMRLARAVHAQGYKVVLTGEGADEALAGYAWFKTQEIRDMLNWGPMALVVNSAEPAAWRWPRSAAATPARASAAGFAGVRTAQQDVYDFMGQARSLALFRRHVEPAGRSLRLRRPGHHQRPLHALGPAEPVALRRLQGDAGRALAPGQGRPGGDELVGRGALSAPGRRRDRLLRLDRAGVQAARARPTSGCCVRWPRGRCPPRIANRPKTMFRASRSEAFLGPDRPPWVDQLLSPESLSATGWFDPEAVARERAAQVRFPAHHPQADHHGPEPDVRHRHPALAPHLPRRRPLRAADVGRCSPARADPAPIRRLRIGGGQGQLAVGSRPRLRCQWADGGTEKTSLLPGCLPHSMLVAYSLRSMLRAQLAPSDHESDHHQGQPPRRP